MSERTGKSRTLQALWLAVANLSSLSVTLVMQAILCRYMTTSEYGTYSQVLYVYNTLLVVFSLGLPKAYSYYLARVSPEEGRDVVCKLNVWPWRPFSHVFCFGRPPR